MLSSRPCAQSANAVVWVCPLLADGALFLSLHPLRSLLYPPPSPLSLFSVTYRKKVLSRVTTGVSYDLLMPWSWGRGPKHTLDIVRALFPHAGVEDLPDLSLLAR